MNRIYALVGIISGMMVVAVLSAAFLLALAADFQPEETGFLSRWLYFSWRYCLPASIAPVLLFLFVYARQFCR